MPARCLSCGNSFAAQRQNQKYCSARCRERQHAQRKAAVVPPEEHRAERFRRQDAKFRAAMLAAGYRQS